MCYESFETARFKTFVDLSNDKFLFFFSNQENLERRFDFVALVWVRRRTNSGLIKIHSGAVNSNLISHRDEDVSFDFCFIRATIISEGKL